MRWKIFYSDGVKVWTVADGEVLPHDAEPRGVICIVGYDNEDKRYIACGTDFYCYDRAGQCWINIHDWFGVIDRTMTHDQDGVPLSYALKAGRTIDRGLYQEIMNAAHRDPDFPLAVY